MQRRWDEAGGRSDDGRKEENPEQKGRRLSSSQRRQGPESAFGRGLWNLSRGQSHRRGLEKVSGE